MMIYRRLFSRIIGYMELRKLEENVCYEPSPTDIWITSLLPLYPQATRYLISKISGP
jgi:hypothetical protein